MEIVYAPRALEDIKYWKKSGNKAVQNKIKALLDAIQDNPFDGIGKPEPLKYSLSGAWSRRINEEHRLVYEVIGESETQTITIFSMKGHY
jgi:toxin YoeB